jgi:hypothetical protein
MIERALKRADHRNRAMAQVFRLFHGNREQLECGGFCLARDQAAAP